MAFISLIEDSNNGAGINQCPHTGFWTVSDFAETLIQISLSWIHFYII